MYGLKQVAKLARDQLVAHLQKFGYHPTPHAQNIWEHETRKTKFCLCVDDFGIKYYNSSDAEHLLSALKQAYTGIVDQTGANFCGLDIEWHYKKGYVDISMPEYVQKVLLWLKHIPPSKPQNYPHRWVHITYGKSIHTAPEEDTSPLLSPIGVQYIQRVVGSFLYYVRAIDNTIHLALNGIGSQQSKPTQNTNDDVDMLMDYLHTHPNAKLRFHKSNMQLHINSDASYLC
jgi:hypothetical protein